MDNNVEVAKYSRKDEDGLRVNPRDYQVETAGLQTGSTGSDSRGHCCKSQLDGGEDSLFVNQMTKNTISYSIYGNN